MAADDLSAPLGQNTKRKGRLRLPGVVPQALAGALALFIIVFAAWALVVEDPLGGEPVAVVMASAPGKPDAAGPTAATPPVQGSRNFDSPASPTQTPPAAATGTQTITIIDGSTGKRQEVAIPSLQDKNVRVESRLLEPSRHGNIPRIGPDGIRPAEAYARAMKPNPAKPNAPRVAIVIGGLGIGSGATQLAFTKLSGAVTFAFAPYGQDIERLVTRARSDGHEVLLQVPMEPFEYPDNDPGPQTLLLSLAAEQNIDRLHWLMSRFQGYVGIANYMGARFTSSEQALAPILRELNQRGLLYFDDGTSPRSLVSQLSGSNGLPFAKADITIDAVPTQVHIDRALTRLEAMARERGVFVAYASALPASIERIAQWAKAAEARGIVLVPISAIAIKPKSS